MEYFLLPGAAGLRCAAFGTVEPGPGAHFTGPWPVTAGSSSSVRASPGMTAARDALRGGHRRYLAAGGYCDRLMAPGHQRLALPRVAIATCSLSGPRQSTGASATSASSCGKVQRMTVLS